MSKPDDWTDGWWASREEYVPPLEKEISQLKSYIGLLEARLRVEKAP